MINKKLSRAMKTILIVAAASFFAASLFMVGAPGVNMNDNASTRKTSPQANLSSSDISAQNAYTGTGAPLNLQEWADSKNVTTSRSLIGAGTTTANIRLAEGWTGYKMYTNVYNLYDTVEWAQFTTMAYDGTANGVNNGVWNFARDAAGANVETGTDTNAPQNGCFVNLNPAWDGTWTHWSLNDNGWWEQIVPLPRGQIAAMWIAYDYYKNPVGFAFSGWEMTHSYVSINGTYAYEISANNMGADSVWNSVAVQQVPQSIINNLNTASGGSACKIQLRVGLRSTQTFQSQPHATADIFYRNVRIFVKALARSQQANLRVAFSGAGGNGGAQNVIQNIGTTFGTGQLNYSATPSPWVAGAIPMDIISTITTNETRLYPADNLENVQFDMYQVIYGSHIRSTQTGASALAPAGANFVAANNSKIDWTMYFYDRPPQVTGTQQDYTDYTFNGSKPADWEIYSVLDSQPVNKTSVLAGRLNGSTFVTMPKANASFYGFWTLSARSRNYVQSMQVPSTIYQGKPLQITGSIINSGLTNSYIGLTKAVLTIKFPNGTVWAGASKVVNVQSPSRAITFPAITIPTNGSNYIPGLYTAILSWNNSRLGLPLNESGCMVRTFTVFHNATLTPQYTIYWNNVNTLTPALPIELRYVDTGGADISDALITFTNFNSNLQNFTHVSGFYNYLTLLDCYNGNFGLNVITIHATSPEFQPITLIIQVEVVRASNFTIDQYPSVNAQWNDNFSLVLHYNDSAAPHNPIGIKSPNNITVNWSQEVGKYWVNMAQNSSGIFTLVFNTTGTLPNKIYTVPISIKRIGFQTQTVTMTITITPRLASLNLVPISDLAFGSLLNVSGTYKELSSGNPIVNKGGALHTYAWIIGGPNCTISGSYAFTLNSALLLNLGKYTLRVDFKWSGAPYYANLTTTLIFNLVQRSTQAYASNTFDTKYWGSNFTIPINYVDVINGSAINGANVHITIYATYQGVSIPTVNTKTQITFGSGAWNLNFDATQFGHTSINPGFNIVIFVNWTRTKAPYYVNQTVIFTIKIDQAPTFIYIVDPSKQTVPSGYNNTITFNLINQRTGKGINATQGNITITSPSYPLGIPKQIFNPNWGIDGSKNNGSYILTFNITTASSDFVPFNISIHMSFYANVVNYSFTLIKIAPVPLIELVKVEQVYLGQPMNITIFYHLQGVSTGIPNAKITVQDGPKSGNWTGVGDFTTRFDGTTNYNITFTPSFTNHHVNKTGSFSVFINCSSTKGNSQIRVNFVINPIPDMISRVYFNDVNYTGILPTYLAYMGDMVNLKVSLKNINGSAIPNAVVSLTLGAFTRNFTQIGLGLNYTVTINTTIFGVGPFIFTVSASKVNFQPASQQIKLDIQAVTTAIVLSLNQTRTSSYELFYGQNLRVAFLYNDTHNGALITNLAVTHVLTGGLTSITAFALNASNWWYVTFNSTTIGAPGTYFMTLTAGLTNYQTARATFIVTVKQIPTTLTAYNSTGKPQSTFALYWDQMLLLAVLYRSTITGANITGATISVSGMTPSSTWTSGPWYNFQFDLGNVVPNVYTISISASLANHTSSTNLTTVTVYPLTTDLQIYNGAIPTMSFSQVFGRNIVVTLYLRDTINSLVVPGISLTSVGTIANIGSGNYTVTVNTNLWAKTGIVQFTITAQKQNYTASSKVITVNILPISTIAYTFINNKNRTTQLSETIDYLIYFLITIYYRDLTNGLPIHGGNVFLKFENISGTYIFNLTEIGSTGNYTMLFSSRDLGASKQYVFSLTAEKSNYDGQATKINIFLNPIPIALNVTVNGVSIHEAQTINVIYSDQMTFLVKLFSYFQGNSMINGSNTTVTISLTVNNQTVGVSWSPVDNAYAVSISTNLPVYRFGAGLTTQVLVISNADGYKSETRSILVHVNPVPTSMGGLINSTSIGTPTPPVYYLTQQVQFHLSFDSIYGASATLAGTNDSLVVLSFLNDTTSTRASINLTAFLIAGLGYFECIVPLNLNTFASGYKEFLITGTRPNYQTQQLKVIIDIRKIPVIWNLNMTLGAPSTIDAYTGDSINFRIQLFNNLTSVPFTDVSTIVVTLTTQWGEIITMTPEKIGSVYTGVFYTSLKAPGTPATYTLSVKVDFTSTDLISLYDMRAITPFYLHVSAPQRPDLTPYIIALLIGIIVVSVWFILYQVRFKYPPTIRKIMDMRRAVARTRDASKIHPAKVLSREENIYNHYAKIINDYSFLQTRDSRYATKAPGYAPTPDGKTSLEWDIPALEGPELPQAVPKGVKKEGAAKGYRELPMPKPAPVPAAAEAPPEFGEERPSAPVVTAPARPVKPAGVPTVPARPPVKPVKPVGLAALPKPSVAPLKAYRAPAAATKPAPVAEGAGESHENLYQQLVLLEQKRYKAERSARDLDAKHNKGLVNDTDYKNYMEKINGGLDKIKSQIADIRRKLISF